MEKKPCSRLAIQWKGTKELLRVKVLLSISVKLYGWLGKRRASLGMKERLS